MKVIYLFERLEDGTSRKVLQRYARNDGEISDAVKAMKGAAKRYYGVTECYTVIND